MELRIDKNDASNTSVDRDGTLNDYGRQGFDVWIGGVKLHFEDEDDAVALAERILQRMSVLFVGELSTDAIAGGITLATLEAALRESLSVLKLR